MARVFNPRSTHLEAAPSTSESRPHGLKTRATKRRSFRGILTVSAMFLLGGAVLWGLFQAPRAAAPSAPDVPWGVPARALRFVTLECSEPGGAPASVDEIVAAVRPFDPDFVLLQRVRSEDAVPLAAALGMQQSYHPQFFRALGTRPRGVVGCLVLSRHPLYDAEALRVTTGSGACFGVRAVSVVDGVRFAVVSARLRSAGADVQPATTDAGSPEELTRHAQALGSPPVVAGVAFEGGHAVPAAWQDASGPAQPADAKPRAALLINGGWTARDGGSAATAATGRQVRWSELAGTRRAPTQPVR